MSQSIPVPILTEGQEINFWNKVNKTENCWLWTACSDRYGKFWISKKCYRSHRVSWTIHKGIIPTNLDVLHKCDNTLCVNPDHLFLGTQTDNMKDCRKKERSGFIVSPKNIVGEGNYKAILTIEDVKIIKTLLKNGTRVKDICKQFPQVKRAAITSIQSNISWKHVHI